MSDARVSADPLRGDLAAMREELDRLIGDEIARRLGSSDSIGISAPSEAGSDRPWPRRPPPPVDGAEPPMDDAGSRLDALARRLEGRLKRPPGRTDESRARPREGLSADDHEFPESGRG